MIAPGSAPSRPVTHTHPYRSGFSLPGAYYRQPGIYQTELDRIWRAGWLFAGHSVQIRNPGDYFLFEIGDTPLIITRTEIGAVAALPNGCRHRGSLILTEPAGHHKRLVCPYHQWTYGLNGQLMTCRGMPADLNRAQWGLRPAAVKEMAGLIFVCLAAEPPDFGPAWEVMAPLAKPQGFDRARLAHQVEYEVRANWKIVWENNRECYHCDVNHPQHIKANFDRYDTDELDERITRQVEAATARSQAKWAAEGLAVTHPHAGLFHFPDAEHNIWFSANRTALVDGYVTESLDGRPVAPLMGDYRDPDVGTLRLRTLPNFWCHASSDHAVTTRLTPAGLDRTRITVTWLVAENALPVQDYSLDRLLPFWKLTSEQDWEICENVQRGVESAYYQPGKLSPIKEYNVVSFLDWYICQLTEAGAR